MNSTATAPAQSAPATVHSLRDSCWSHMLFKPCTDCKPEAKQCVTCNGTRHVERKDSGQPRRPTIL